MDEVLIVLKIAQIGEQLTPDEDTLLSKLGYNMGASDNSSDTTDAGSKLTERQKDIFNIIKNDCLTTYPAKDDFLFRNSAILAVTLMSSQSQMIEFHRISSKNKLTLDSKSAL